MMHQDRIIKCILYIHAYYSEVIMEQHSQAITDLCWSRVVKLAAMTQVDWGFFSPWDSGPFFAPLKRSISNRLISLLDCGSSTPKGTPLSQRS